MKKYEDNVTQAEYQLKSKFKYLKKLDKTSSRVCSQGHSQSANRTAGQYLHSAWTRGRSQREGICCLCFKQRSLLG
jgi:hypothetical protein